MLYDVYLPEAGHRYATETWDKLSSRGSKLYLPKI